MTYLLVVVVVVAAADLTDRGVWNSLKILVFSFLKTEPNRR